MKLLIILLVLATLAGGCTSKSMARAQAQQAYLAGQNAALQRAAQAGGITVNGPVQNHNVPWVVGLTLTQAIATANFLGPDAPTQIILTRQGEDGVTDPQTLLNGAQIPLEPGDMITLK
jgi:type II secretory pathway pseudopilin PulG